MTSPSDLDLAELERMLDALEASTEFLANHGGERREGE